ncbi:Leucyl aminopeptidase [Mycena indigotica]|uniref:Leucyl aminopeptidase n=1 Tax=Mycena indigotica TaxID=2126181 RepID=A0A8H6SKS5_9AGAR|nr:Leucyl aminopeptidase [Mycena indigotica]KAF7301221.1 Leucyl aminopeptidase [Mycena indigotica]
MVRLASMLGALRELPITLVITSLALASNALPAQSQSPMSLPPPLTPDNFQSTIAKGLWFIEHFSPWCGHCRAFAPTWEKLVEMNKDSESIQLAQVDCSVHGDLCTANGVGGYPQMNIYRDGQFVEKFKGSRDLDLLNEFLNKHKPRSPPPPPPPTVTLNKNGEVAVLTPDSFQGMVEQGPAFIKFYAPWCGHCKKLAPIWKQLGKIMQSKVTIGEVDCEANEKFCKAQGISGYPTLVYYPPSGEKSEYSGGRKLEQLKAFVEKASASATQPIQPEEIEAYVSDNAVMYLLLHPENDSYLLKTITRLAAPLLGSPIIFTSASPSLFERYAVPKTAPWAIIALKDHDPHTAAAMYLGSATVDSASSDLPTWLLANRLPTSMELMQDTFQSIMNAPHAPLVVIAAVTKDTRDKVSERFRDIALKWRVHTAGTGVYGGRSVVFTWMDADRWADWLKSMYGLKKGGGELEDVGVVIADHKALQYYDTEQSGGIIKMTSPSIFSALEGAASGSIAPKNSENFVERMARSMNKKMLAFEHFIVDQPLYAIFLMGLVLVVIYLALRRCVGDDQVSKASVAIIGSGASASEASNCTISDKSPDRLTLSVPSLLNAGSKAEVTIAFHAPLRDSMNGYYKSAWKRDGKTEYYALTQFQPTDARAAFPCWDEPALKAKFTVTMISRADTVNLSNMPVASETSYNPNSGDFQLPEGLWKVTTFDETPPMSTYIVAFANGPFEFMEDKVKMPLSGRTIPIRIYATPDLVSQAGFCLEVTAKVLPIYEQMFDIEFPLPKLDTLAANDFDMGAMENWGLITGRTRAFLTDPTRNDIGGRKIIAQITAHELAHMWFGNIATMEWWDCLYLNEGFASLMGEAIALDKVFPEWEVKSAFLTRHTSSALAVDAKRSSHAIEVPCPDVAFLNQIFDGLSYSKAASVLRMLSNFVGEDKFLKGTSIYLKEHLYGNTVSRDLWDGISAATGAWKYLSPTLVSNNLQMGYPLLRVTETAEGITVRQDRFFDNGLPTEEENTTIWTIPLSIRFLDEAGQVKTDTSLVLNQREMTFPINTSKPFKLNSDAIGVYRVLYSPERFSKIAAEAAKSDSIFTLDDRMGLIYDLAALSSAGLVGISSLLDVLDKWRNETTYMVWSSAWTSLNNIMQTFWEYPAIITGMKTLLQTLFAPILDRLGYDFPDGESVQSIELRRIAIAACAKAETPSVIQELHHRVIKYLEGDELSVPPGIQQTAFGVAAQVGGRLEFDGLLKLCENAVKPAVKTNAILGIGKTQDPALLEELFDYIATKARDQDVASFCRGLQVNPAARRMLAKFARDKYEIFSDRFGTNSMLKYFVEECFCTLTTQQDYDGIEAFFKDKDTSRYNMALAQVLETIQSQIVAIKAIPILIALIR